MRQKSQLKNSLSFNHAPITPDHEPGPSNQRLVLTNNGSRLVIGMGDEAQLEVGPIPHSFSIPIILLLLLCI